MSRTLVGWSSGKDSAWMLGALRAQADVELVALVTTFNAEFDRVAMHGVRRELVEAQAAAAGVPLWAVPLPWPCPNETYEARMREVVERGLAAGADSMAFGDLYLADIRAYRERQLAGTGITPRFPIWCGDGGTAALARAMIDTGLRAVVTCVDAAQLDPAFAGRDYDAAFLDDLPAGVDPCGENGEFHTFCHAAPGFDVDIPVVVGECVERDGFVFCDVLPDRDANLTSTRATR